MAGLESIALAVAHLEQESQKENERGEIVARWGWQTSETPPFPPRQPITARNVSSDSCFSSDEHEPTRWLSTGDGIHTMITEGEMTDATPPTLESLFESEKSKPNIPTPDMAEDISEINDNDVLCGRGGETNHWSGNVRYRSLVKYYQRLYLEARRRDKPLIARVIVRTVRLRGGRFLKKDANSKFWRDVGNQRAREKTSQALREGAPDLRNNTGEQPSPRAKNPKQRSHQERLGEIDFDIAKEMQSERSSPGKRRRVSLEDFANIVTCSSSLKASDSSSTVLDRESPHFPTASSGDDDESGSDQSSPSPRGPRLFILKQRLMAHSAV